MTDYHDYDDDDYESEEDYDCGWDGEDMCGHIGSEHCSFWCPFYKAGILDSDDSVINVSIASDGALQLDIDDIPF